MHTPNPGQSDPDYDPNDDAPDPPVPPDREDEIVPVKEPPGPARGDEPMIA